MLDLRSTGDLARHGELAEEERRRWVLRTVLAVVGLLEYLDGDENVVDQFVVRLELDRGSEDDRRIG